MEATLNGTTASFSSPYPHAATVFSIPSKAGSMGVDPAEQEDENAIQVQHSDRNNKGLWPCTPFDCLYSQTNQLPELIPLQRPHIFYLDLILMQPEVGCVEI